MKTMKKVLAFLLTVAMVLAMGVTAFAEDATPTTGSITISNPEKDVTYTAYKIFKAVPYGGANDTASVTASTAGSAVYYATAEQKAYWEGNDSNLFVFTKEGDEYNVSLKDGVGAQQIAEFFNTHETDKNLIASVGEGIEKSLAEGATVVTWTGLAFGYYFISSHTGSVVSIDTTNYNVVIEDKNNYSSPFDPGHGDNLDGSLKNVYKLNGKEAYETKEDGGKEVVPVSVRIGDEVTYRISTSTSNYVTKDNTGALSTTGDKSEKVTYVYVNDSLGAGLTLDENSFAVKVGGTAINSAYYAVKTNVVNGKTVFTVKLQWVDNNGDHLYADGSVIDIEYNATVNKIIDVVDYTGNPAANANNVANVTIDSEADNGWTPDPDDPNPVPDPVDPTPDPDDPNPTTGKDGKVIAVQSDSVGVYIYALAIQKIAKDTNLALQGAKFTVKDSDGKELKFTKNTDGVYVYAKEGGNATVVSDEKGAIVMKGVNADTFTYTETKAPTGYNLLTAPKDFDAIIAGQTKTTTTATTTTYYKLDEAGTFKKEGDAFVAIAEGEAVEEKYAISDTVTELKEEKEDTDFFKESAVIDIVENAQGTELPSTGGMGTTIFYMVGAILVLGAGILLVTRKRMSVR